MNQVSPKGLKSYLECCQTPHFAPMIVRPVRNKPRNGGLDSVRVDGGVIGSDVLG